MEILVPPPKKYAITSTMVDDFLIDPCLGAKVIMGIELDWYQMSMLRTLWWIPEVYVSSGLGTAKTFVTWVWLNLRLCLIPDQHAASFFQSFDAGKRNMWDPYYPMIEQSPKARIFQAQLGEFKDETKAEGKGAKRGASSYTYNFRNGGKHIMSAPDWVRDADNQAGQNFNVIWIDEYGKILNTNTDGIERQLLGRLRRKCWNQDHPLWCNHQVFTTAAESRGKRSYSYIKAAERRIEAGDPTVAHISYSFKDYSNKLDDSGQPFKKRYRDEKMLKRLKDKLTASHYLQEVLGIWSLMGANWYDLSMLEQCIAKGKQAGLEVEAVKG